MYIKLSNLALATEQQVFDQVTNHLLAQKVVSVAPSGGYCAYRGNNNKMCAAGCLIGPEEYVPEMDSFNGDTSWEGLIFRKLVPSTPHNELIGELQVIHDTDKPHVWEEALKNLANTRGLAFNFVSEETV